MPPRPRRGRAEIPKTPSSVSERSVQNLRKPKAYQNVNEDSNESSIRTTTPTSTPGRSARSSKSRASAHKSRAFISKVAYKVNDDEGRSSEGEADDYDHEEGESQCLGSDDSDFDDSKLDSVELSDSDDDSVNDIYHDEEEEEEDEDGEAEDDNEDDEACSSDEESVMSTLQKTEPRKLLEPSVQKLELPKSSHDLNMPLEHLMEVVAIYETLRHYQAILRLSPFRLEDFCVALQQPEQSCLLGEIHMSLLKALLREEDANNTTFGPQDLMHSINISFMFMDSMTWPELVRAYLESERCWEFQSALDAYNECENDYPFADIKTKVLVLKTLSDMFLASNAVREEIVNEGHIQYDDHCRVCHKLGDLLCCETCPAVFHLNCVEPPLTEVPEDDWLCSICKAHELKGVTDRVADGERSSAMCRQDPLGYDRHRRKYWYICRRIIVEDYTTGEVWYYSTPSHVKELLEVLDARKYERSLVRAITVAREEIDKQMEISIELTRAAAGKSRGCVIEDEAGELTKTQHERSGVTQNEKKTDDEEKTKSQDKDGGDEMDEDKAEESDVKTEDTMVNGTDSSDKPKTIEEMEAESAQVGSAEDSSSKELGANSGCKDTGEPVDQVDEDTGEKVPEKVPTPEETSKREHGVNAGSEKKVAQKTSSGLQSMSDENKARVAEAIKMLSEASKGGATAAETQAKLEEANKYLRKQGRKIELFQTVNPNASSAAKSKVFVLRLVDFKPTDESEEASDLPDQSQGGKKASQSASGGENQSEERPNSACSKEGSEETGPTKMLTRSRTGSARPKQFTDAVVSLSGSVKMTSKTGLIAQQDETQLRDMVVPDDMGRPETRSMTRAAVKQVVKPVDQANGGTLSVASLPKPQISMTEFRFGDDFSFRQYVNQYSTNSLALNKHQHNEEKDKRRHLSYKFSLTPASDFKWFGHQYGTRQTTIVTLRNTISHLETALPPALLHPNWPLHQKKWRSGVQNCSTPEDFGQALILLEACMKSCLFTYAWRESLGHLKLHRVTAMEREDMKKKEKEKKKKEDDEEVDKSSWVKYPKGLKHQIWKQRGEEYRLTGQGGWHWLSNRRTYRYKPYQDQGLLGLAKRTRLERELKSGTPRPSSRSSNKSTGDDYVNMSEKSKTLVVAMKPLNLNGAASVRADSPHLVDDTKDVPNGDTTEELEGKMETEKDTEKAAENSKESIETGEEKGMEDSRQNEVKKEADESKLTEKKPAKSLFESVGKEVERDPSDEQNQLNAGTSIPDEDNEDEDKKEDPDVDKAEKMVENLSQETGENRDDVSARMDQSIAEDDVTDDDVINVTLGLKDRKVYPRGKKPYCRLDNLLEKRLRMHADEMRRKATLMNLLNKLQEMKEKLASENMKKKEEEKGEKKSETAFKKDETDANDIGSGLKEEVCQGSRVKEEAIKSETDETKCETSEVKTNESHSQAEGQIGEVGASVDERSVAKFPEKVEDKSSGVTLDLRGEPPDTTEKVVENGCQSDNMDCVEASEMQEKSGKPESETSKTLETAETPDETPSPGHDNETADAEKARDASSVQNIEEKCGEGIKLNQNGDASDKKNEVKTGNQVMKLPGPSGDYDVNVDEQSSNEKETQEKTITAKGDDAKPEKALARSEKTDAEKLAEAAKVSSEQLSKALRHLATLSDDKLADLRSKMPKDRSTRDPVRIIQHRGASKKTRLRRGVLPPQENFVDKDSSLNVLLLDWYSRKRMARCGGMRETDGFNYNCKMANVNWNYPCPRPSIQRVWRYKSQGLRTLAAAALQLRILWTCIRWDDVNTKPPIGGVSTVSTDMDITTRELLKRKDIGPYQMRSEYLVRKVIVPLSAGQADSKDRDYTPIRSGLRQRKRPDSPKLAEPSMKEYWIPETKLELWEIKLFHEKMAKQRLSLLRKDVTPVTVVKNAVDLKNQLEEEIKKQRLLVTQKRLLEGKVPESPPTTRAVISVLPSSMSTRSVTGARKIIIRPASALPTTSTILRDVKGNVIQAHKTDTTSVKAMLESKQAQGGKLTSPGADKIIRPQQTVSTVTFTVVAGPPPPPPEGEEAQTVSAGGISVKGLKPGQHLVKTQDGRLTVIQLPAGNSLKPGTTVTMNHHGPSGASGAGPKPALAPSVIRPSFRPSVPQAGRALFIQTKEGLRPLRPGGAGVSLLRPGGVLQQSPPKIVIRPAVSVITHGAGDGNLPQSVQPVSGDLRLNNQRFAVSPQVIQQVVQRALLQQNQTPEIQAKLLAIQEKMGGKPTTVIRTSSTHIAPSGRDRPMRTSRPRDDDYVDIDEALYQMDADDEPYKPYSHQPDNAQDRRPKRKLKDVITPVIMRAKEPKPKKVKKEVSEVVHHEKQKRLISSKLQTILYKHKEALKKDILKKRAILDKALHADVSNELMQRQKEIRKQKKRALQESLSGGAVYQSDQTPLPVVERAFDHTDLYDDVKPKKKKKQKIISTGGNENDGKRTRGGNKLYCVCKTPYDETQFYIGCDMCSNWFHGDCVNISETDAQMLSSYVCQECRHQRDNRAEELYCLCRTPYDESQFYIGCEECQDWFHTECVGIDRSEAEKMDFYLCPRCKQSSEQNVVAFASTKLDRKLVDGLKRLVRSLAAHKMAWPFLDPVDERDVPDYYDVIKDPMDLSTVEKKLLAGQYHAMGDVMRDITKIFDNCRYYNSNDSHVFQCAESLEDFYREKLKQFKQKANS